MLITEERDYWNLDAIYIYKAKRKMVQAESRSATDGAFIKTTSEPTTKLPPTQPIKIMGPFKYFIRFSGFDCSSAHNIKSCCGIISLLIAIGVLVIIIVKAMLIMGVSTEVLEIGWAESSVYGFMSLQMFNAGLCLVSWTRDKFVSEFEERLSRIRQLRLSFNANIDSYKKFHWKAFIMIIPIFAVILATSITAAVDDRYAKNETNTFNSTSKIFRIAPVMDFFGCLSTSLSLVLFVTINVALSRELEHFNKELTTSARTQQLILPNILNGYSKRHSDLIQLVKFANLHLNKYASIVPLFTILAAINSIYLLSNYFSDMQRLYAIFMIGWAIISMGITIACLSSAAKVQDQIKETAQILMDDDIVQIRSDDQMYNTYRVILDRSLYSNAHCSLIYAFSINSQFFYRVMVITPNVATLLKFYQKTLVLANY